MTHRSLKANSHAPRAVVYPTTVGVIRTLDQYVAACMNKGPICIGPRLRRLLGESGGSWARRKQRAYFVLLDFEDLGLSRYKYTRERPLWCPPDSHRRRWFKERKVSYETIVRRAKLLGLDRPTFAEALEGRLCFGRIGIPGTELHFMMPLVRFKRENGQTEMGICCLASPINDIYEEHFDLNQTKEFRSQTDVTHYFLFVAKSYKQLTKLLERRKKLQPLRELRDERTRKKRAADGQKQTEEAPAEVKRRIQEFTEALMERATAVIN